MSIRNDIRAQMIAAIQAATTASVVGPRNWPDDAAKLPTAGLIIVQSPAHETSKALVVGPPSYETHAIFPVTVRVARQAVSDADGALQALVDQIRAGIFSWLPFQQLIEQVATMETRSAIAAEGQFQVGEAVILFETVFPEFYSPAPGIPLAEIQGTVKDQVTGVTLETFDVKF